MPVENLTQTTVGCGVTTGWYSYHYFFENPNHHSCKHYHQASPGPSEPSTSERPGGDEEAVDLEDPGVLADSESPPGVVGKQRQKRKRVRVIKQNDSVSDDYWPRSPGLFVPPDEDGRLASASIGCP